MSNDVLRDLRGFGTVEKWVLTDPEISTSAKALYALICAYAGNKGQSFPSTSLLSHQLSISRPTLQKSINELKSKLVISVEQKRSGGRFSHNVYSLLNRPKATVAKNTDNGKTDDSNSDDSNSGDNEVYTKNNSVKNNSVKSNTNNKDINAVACISQEKPKQNKNSKQSLINRMIENDVSPDVAEEFFDYRKTIKRNQLTDRALSAIINNCIRNSFPLEKALITCMERGWISFNYEWVAKGSAPNSNITKRESIERNNELVVDSIREKIMRGEI